MRWSTTLGRFAGIDVKVHVTFWLLIAWVAISHWRADAGAAGTLAGVAFILALFTCVVLHEFGHALTARRYGVKTRDIILLPIGGVARLEQIPENPRHELWITLAGPAVNVVIAMVLGLWLELTGGWQPVAELTVTGGSFVERLLVVNVFLALFNLVPAFPMDGGRILRALLGMRMDFLKATRIAASVGQTLAVGFGVLGLFSNPFLILIALFVWIGAARERDMVQIKGALGGVPVNRVMITDFKTLTPTDSLKHAAELTLSGSQKHFPVIEESRVVGILTQGDLLEALDRGRGDLPVAHVMRRDFQTAGLSEMIEPVFLRLQQQASRMIPVLADQRLAGLITADNVGEFLSIRAAMRGQ